jgi:hypothetical protein
MDRIEMSKLKHMLPVDPATFTAFPAWGKVISAEEQASGLLGYRL